MDLRDTKGSEQAEFRPWLIVSNDEYHRRFPTVVAVPLSSRVNKSGQLPGARIIIDPSKILPAAVSGGTGFLKPLQGQSVALTEQVRTLSHDRLEGKKAVATLSDDAMADIEAGLAYILDL